MFSKNNSGHRHLNTNRDYLKKYLLKLYPRTIQSIILISFTLVSSVCMLFLGMSMYQRFERRSRQMMTDNSLLMLARTTDSIEDYLRRMRRISDAMYYDVIKDMDFESEDISTEMSLLYEANKDNLVSFALFASNGDLISAAPIALKKDNAQVPEQSWFSTAFANLENLHFSTPHVQNLFIDETDYRYHWVISLSRAVELNYGGKPRMGVLLVDMNYQTIQQMMESVNKLNSDQYVYLITGNGQLIYHPKAEQISLGIHNENFAQAAGYDDGVYEENFEGEKRIVVVDTVSYTGWKLVSVTPIKNFYLGMQSTRYFVILVAALTALAMIFMNQMVTWKVTQPLRKLNESIKTIEAGKTDSAIYIGGTTEVEHLGRTLQRSLDEINRLMKDIVIEQEEKRKSELDALQSQINPHFLYNTLDSIVWMIEGEHYEEAVFMITQLASLFRVSLSKGRTIIPIEDELRHAENYMNIQKVRFKNAFTVNYDIEPEIKECLTVKLIVQPLLENAIYYGVKNMDEDGEITVKGYKDGEDIFIEVIDNGYGIPSEKLPYILTEDKRASKNGSGVGLINVHKRIQLRFGEEYGLKIESEPDEGTKVTIHLPAIPATEENRERLEKGGANG
ncbi:sensor histidine kinase [Butyrivibrio sp. XPD2002]|jgi:two-component system sensor histidine kinase YesM|uniref:sensor histidine kinase n=1 Tax=Butyrivibrio sp. XPD2002 TaxID=1280665 RepID=UPI00047D50B7|nr:sensor histidine kinase [Butyrivibrio sp. XPD2002]